MSLRALRNTALITEADDSDDDAGNQDNGDQANEYKGHKGHLVMIALKRGVTMMIVNLQFDFIKNIIVTLKKLLNDETKED